MATTIRVTVEDITEKITSYDQILVYRGLSATGTFNQIGTVSLVVGTYQYSFVDSTGNLNYWYKYSFYNSTTLAESDKSVPFRPENTTRLRIRQNGLVKYNAGIVLTAASGSAVTGMLTDDYRFKTSLIGAGHGKGSWLYASSGSLAGSARMVSDSTPSSGSFSVEPSWPSAPASGDEFEWHWLARPDQWESAINRGLARYYFLDRIPIKGVASANEYDLNFLPWLKNKRQILGLRVRYSGSTLDSLWGVGGTWWKAKQDRDSVTLQVNPTISVDDVFWLEVARPMQPLWNDTDSPPTVCSEDLAAALAYDEILALLSHPTEGSRVDRSELVMERKLHQITELARLLKQERADAPFSVPQQPTPPSVPHPFKAR